VSAHPHARRRAIRCAIIALCAACSSGAPRGAVAPAADTLYHPAHDLGALFHDVQMAPLFDDSKTFVDAQTRSAPQAVRRRYADARSTTSFSLRSFVEQYFDLPSPVGSGFRADTARTMEQHIRALWPLLTRPPDERAAHSSLIPLPHAYVVPGGRFREVYYWDSYFTMLGLVESGRIETMRGMLDNFAHLIDTFGHIPNGNRTYYLSRSQPPFFGAMVGLYALATDTLAALDYLTALEREHAFWMQGAASVAPGTAHRRVVRMHDGAILNRYRDDLPEPRPESYREDYTLAPR
jgi:alpha,alpha-trehalase